MFDCIPWNVSRCICSGVETASAVVNCMESESKCWGLVSKMLNTGLMPFIFVELLSVIFVLWSVLIMVKQRLLRGLRRVVGCFFFFLKKPPTLNL